MKNKLGILLKNSLTNTYKLRSMTKKKLLLIIGLVAYVFVSIFAVLSNYFENIYEKLSDINLSNYYLTIIFSFYLIEFFVVVIPYFYLFS